MAPKRSNTAGPSAPIVTAERGIELLRRQTATARDIGARIPEEAFDRWITVSRECVVKSFGGDSEQDRKFTSGSRPLMGAWNEEYDPNSDEACAKRSEIVRKKSAQLETFIVLLEDAIQDQLPDAKPPDGAPPRNELLSLDFFVSHCSRDDQLAGAVARLLQLAFSLPPDRIRCTSAPGFKLPCGADTDEQLRSEVHGCKVLVGILTPASVSAPYVLFELGARWGVGKPLAPLLAAGANATELPGPLKGKNALLATRREDLSQFLDNVGEIIGKQPAPASSLENDLQHVLELASVCKPEEKRGVTSPPAVSAGDLRFFIEKWVNEHFETISDSGVIDFAEIARDSGVQIQDIAQWFQLAVRDTEFRIKEMSARFAKVEVKATGNRGEAFG